MGIACAIQIRKTNSDVWRSGFMKRATSLMVLAFLAFSLLSRAETVKLRSSSTVPAAEGDIYIENDDNGNTVLTVHVKHLAKPSELTPPKSNYIVWIQEEGKNAEAFGNIQVNKDLKGEVKGTTPHKKFDVFITAEDNSRPEGPSGAEVMRGIVTRQ